MRPTASSRSSANAASSPDPARSCQSHPRRRSLCLPETKICSVIDSYVKHLGNHDVDELVALFATDAVQHEPLGVRTYRASTRSASSTRERKVAFTMSRHSPIVVSGRYSAMQLRVQREACPTSLPADLFEFDDTGKIVSLSVVWTGAQDDVGREKPTALDALPPRTVSRSRTRRRG
ncbi:hypothetical protein GS540_27185 [Rhodococcus hoagii]|nr:hypothetical protein [Prescottella equi]